MKKSEAFHLLTALTHPSAQQQITRVNDLVVGGNIDWMEFLQLVRWHRVTPQVYRNLAAFKEHLSQPVFQQLNHDVIRCQRNSLLQTAWLVKISRLFKDNHIRFIVLKGVALSQYLYAECGNRESKDLDILIDEADITRAEQLLETALGFKRIHPDPSTSIAEIKYLTRITKDRVYNHQDGTEIEIHWRFVIEWPLLAASFSDLIESSTQVKINNQSITVLNNKHLWLYQSLHGTRCGWYRLHWLSDIAELLANYQPDWPELLEMADQYHCKRCLIEAVALAGEIYKLPIPSILHLPCKRTAKRKLSVPVALRNLSRKQIPNPYITLFRGLFWLPRKYYILFLLLRIAQKPVRNPDWHRKHPGRFVLFHLLRPVASIIRFLIYKLKL